jgi:hypothetical protein
VEEARNALGRFLGDILTPQEEAIRELNRIKSDLLTALICMQNGEPAPNEINLKKIFAKVDRFGALSSSSEEMSSLINEIMSAISQVAGMMNK